MELKTPLTLIRQGVGYLEYGQGNLNYYERQIVDKDIQRSATIVTLGSITVGAEAMDIHLSSEPNTVKNNLLRAGCRAVAVGAGYLTARTIGALSEE